MTLSVSKAWTRTVVLSILVLGLVQLQAPSVYSNPDTLLVPSQYSTIQNAVDAAVAGDVILVSAGTYSENVLVTKSVSIVGESRDTTVVDAPALGPGINITRASNVLVSGFTVRSSGLYDGFDILASSNVTIFGNRIQASLQSFGVYVFNSTRVRLIGNELTGNLRGVNIQSGSGTLVQANNMTGNTIGLSLFTSNGNKVVDNMFRLGEQGLELRDGSTGTVVARNNISNNTVLGINLLRSGSNLIVDNEIANNTCYCLPTGIGAEGVHIQNSTGSILYRNNIQSNDLQVFAVFPPNDIAMNTWDYGSRGNFWGDYVGKDNGDNGRTMGDGVGDTLIPHPCPSGGQPCSASGPAGVDMFPLVNPVAASALNVTASGRPTSGLALLAVSFTGLVSGGGPTYSFSWSFGDGSTGTGASVSHTYLARGTYFASLTVTDGSSQRGTDYLVITVSETTGSIAVRVTNETGASIVGARVRSLSQPSGQTGLDSHTNSTGFVSFVGLKPGTYVFEASSAGFVNATKNATLTSNQSANLVIVLGRAASADYVLYLAAGVIAAIALAGVLMVYLRRSRAAKRVSGKKP